jgi:hypothetical protein
MRFIFTFCIGVYRLGYEPVTSLKKIELTSRPLTEVLKLDWNEGMMQPI